MKTYELKGNRRISKSYSYGGESECLNLEILECMPRESDLGDRASLTDAA